MTISPPRPQEPQGNPYTPALPEPQVMEQFQGINTSTTRAGVPDAQCYWIDGFFPVGPRQLRTLPGSGSTLYTAPAGKTILFYGFYVLNNGPGIVSYAAVFLSDGSCVQVNANIGGTTTIFPASTLTNPSITTIGLSQYGQQYLLISSTQTNGYWIWDGSVLYTAGTLAPTVVLTNVGAGYTSAPIVTASGGHGYGASFAAQVANGQVTTVAITSPGTGYLAGDTPTLVFSGGTSSGSGGSVTAVMSHAAGGSGGSVTVGFTLYQGIYYVTSATVVAVGSGYSSLTQLSVLGNNYQSYAAVLSLAIAGGTISSVGVFSQGRYISPAATVTVTDPGYYYVSSVSIVAAGSGYSPTAEITATGGGATVYAAAAVSPDLTSGSITSVTIQNGGYYGSNVAPTLTVTDTSTTAAGSITLMPFGISGNAIATYSGHVWIADGPIVYFSAPGSPSNFATSSGGGNFTSSSNVLRAGYTQLISTNGFLYLIGDSSMDYISGVSTYGSPITTTYTLQNADPEVGTPYPASALTLGPDIVLANSFGVHVSRGAALEKVSEPLDGVYMSGGSTAQLCSAKATIFNKRVFMLLQSIVNPITSVTNNELLMWDGAKKWWASQQDFGTITFIATQEIGSQLTAWGTNGSIIKPMFQSASTAFTKAVQSRFWDAPGGYQFSKATGRFWSVWDYNTNSNPTLTVNIDAVTINGANGSTTLTTQGYTITGPLGAGYFVTPPQAVGQQGILTGMTLYTNEGDVSLVSAMIQNDPKISYRG